MEQSKRRRADSVTETEESKRPKNAEICPTKLEDLANELLYEIFKYLDDYQVYRIFSLLNYRFHSLLLQSVLPIQIDLSSMSRSSFDVYRRERILPHILQIHSLHLSNPFILDRHVLPLCSAIHLRTLILDHIEWTDLTNLLSQFNSLVNLHSLSLTALDSLDDYNPVLECIFRLPQLKACQLSFGDTSEGRIFPLTNDQFSPMEHLIIKHSLDLDQLCSLLSYLPHLRRLSVNISGTNYDTLRHKFTWFGHALKHLTHLSLKMCSLSFDDLEQLFIHAFSSIEVLRLEGYRKHLHASDWQRLISSQLIHLRVFDLSLELHEFNAMANSAVSAEVEQFSTSFWIERQWSFECRPARGWLDDDDVFCSVNPYRRKIHQVCESSSIDDPLPNLNSVKSVHITNIDQISDCYYYFPRATELIIGWDIPAAEIAVQSLSSLIPLHHLKILNVECELSTLAKLLTEMPNLTTLHLYSMALRQQNDVFRMVAKTNSIPKIILKEKCSVEKAQLLIALFPRMQYLHISSDVCDAEATLRFLLDQSTSKTNHLHSICYTDVHLRFFPRLKSLVLSGTLPRRCLIRQVHWEIYLWW